MSDSKEYSSLFALVDSHLSKTSISSEQTSKTPFKIPSLRNGPNSSSSEGDITSPLGPCLPISPFNISASPIKSVLAEQVANMLKAKEKKQEEEKRKMVEDMQKLHMEDNNDYVIDLMKVLQTPYKPVKQANQEEVLSNSSSMESLFELKLKDLDDDSVQTVISELPLPCISDISYILNQKVYKSKPSTFGKVLTSRLRPVAAPYLPEKIESNIKPFDFSTPSPCDIHKEKQRKPTMSCSYTAVIEI